MKNKDLKILLIIQTTLFVLLTITLFSFKKNGFMNEEKKILMHLGVFLIIFFTTLGVYLSHQYHQNSSTKFYNEEENIKEAQTLLEKLFLNIEVENIIKEINANYKNELVWVKTIDIQKPMYLKRVEKRNGVLKISVSNIIDENNIEYVEFSVFPNQVKFLDESWN